MLLKFDWMSIINIQDKSKIFPPIKEFDMTRMSNISTLNLPNVGMYNINKDSTKTSDIPIMSFTFSLTRHTTDKRKTFTHNSDNRYGRKT